MIIISINYNQEAVCSGVLSDLKAEEVSCYRIMLQGTTVT